MNSDTTVRREDKSRKAQSNKPTCVKALQRSSLSIGGGGVNVKIESGACAVKEYN